MDNPRKSKLYKVWIDMKNRCNNPNNNHYKNYGARGIKVCKEWQEDYMSFYNWAINNKYNEYTEFNINTTLDRINNNGNYEPSNCRFITHKEQQNNKRNNHLLTYMGETHTVSEWSKILGIKTQTIFTRLRKDLPVEYILSKENFTNSNSCTYLKKLLKIKNIIEDAETKNINSILIIKEIKEVINN